MNRPSDEMFGKLVCELIGKVSDFFIEIERGKVFLKKNIYSLEKKPLFFKNHELEPPLCMYEESDSSLAFFNEVDFLSDMGAFEELTKFFLYTLYLHTLEALFKKILKTLPNLSNTQPFVWYSFDFKGKKYESKEVFFLDEFSKKIYILMKQNTFFYLLNSCMYSLLAQKQNLLCRGPIFSKLYLEVEGSPPFQLLLLNLLENLWNLNSFLLPFFLEKSFSCFNEFFFFLDPSIITKHTNHSFLSIISSDFFSSNAFTGKEKNLLFSASSNTYSKKEILLSMPLVGNDLDLLNFLTSWLSASFYSKNYAKHF